MRTNNVITRILALLLIALPVFVWAQHPETAGPVVHEEHADSALYEIIELIEHIVDVFGIGILIIGFLKGVYVFIKLEIERFSGEKDFEEVFALRSTLGSYIILSLDFLIISDIIHSVLKPEFNELINLGIIVVLRTSIGFFLGRELMELSHIAKSDPNIAHQVDTEDSTHS